MTELDSAVAGYAGGVNSLRVFPALLLVSLLSGCHGAPPSTDASPTAQQVKQTESERAELELIPPPSKTKYLSVHSLDAWENPYLTVQANMVTVHVMLADANPSDAGVGGMMRPVGARRQDLTVSPDKLAEALGAIPRSAWPYGRVAAVEEAHKTPKSAQHDVRRNLEAAMKVLNDLGIVAYEWNESGRQ